ILPDTAVAAALADVVPESVGALLRHARGLDRRRGSAHPIVPTRVARDVAEAVEEAREAGGTVTPAEVIQRLPARLVVKDFQGVAFLVRDRVEVRRSGERRIEKRFLARRLIERREKVTR